MMCHDTVDNFDSNYFDLILGLLFWAPQQPFNSLKAKGFYIFNKQPVSNFRPIKFSIFSKIYLFQYP